MSECSICKDFGVTLYRRATRSVSGATRMIITPQFCQCDSGDKAAHSYEQNLKEGRAGMHGLYPTGDVTC